MAFTPVPKPESTKKTKSKVGKASANPTKGVDMSAVEDKIRTRKEINNQNRNFGKNTERAVAKLTDGVRVPASGAIKNTVHALEGDVQIFYPDSKQMLAMIEVKGTAGISPTGDKTFTLKKSVLDQATREAETQHAIGLVWLHWFNAQHEKDDYAIIPVKHLLKLLDLAKQNYVTGRESEKD